MLRVSKPFTANLTLKFYITKRILWPIYIITSFRSMPNNPFGFPTTFYQKAELPSTKQAADVEKMPDLQLL